MLEPFVVSKGRLGPHWNALELELTDQFQAKPREVLIRPSYVANSAIAAINGSAVRRVGRLRGGDTLVARLMSVGANWEAWIGYREVWRRADTRNQFLFSSADITLFLCNVSSASFQQVLRAEWAGVTNQAGNWTFTPDNAGHPHWHIDITEGLRADAEWEAARQLLRDSAPKDFGASVSETATDPPWYNIGLIHLASAMRPWVEPEYCPWPERAGQSTELGG